VERLGVLGRQTLAIHCVNADDADVALLRGSDTAIAHCPISNAKLGHGAAPVDRFLAAGLRVGLGSDSMASNNRMHMLEESRAAVMSMRIRTRSASDLPASEALELATLGGARALGLEARLGSLEPGKDADLAAFPLGSAATAAVHDPAAAAVWSLGNAVASLVVVQGTELVRDSRILSEDPARDERVRDTARALHLWKRDQGMSSD
jgi:5-methylthioadenosine/S-adenosylhomocysteine deaminase